MFARSAFQVQRIRNFVIFPTYITQAWRDITMRFLFQMLCIRKKSTAGVAECWWLCCAGAKVHETGISNLIQCAKEEEGGEPEAGMRENVMLMVLQIRNNTAEDGERGRHTS